MDLQVQNMPVDLNPNDDPVRNIQKLIIYAKQLMARLDEHENRISTLEKEIK